MARRYPELRDLGSLDKPEGECEACANAATHWVRVAWDYMRGNDDSYRVCQRHMNIAEGSLNRFLAHVGSKDVFLKRDKDRKVKETT